jgi:putative copper resistance protein D
VGGICAIVLLNDSDRRIALPRFSQMALWAAIAVVISGSKCLGTLLNFTSGVEFAYARIIIAKAILTVVLLVIWCFAAGKRYRNSDSWAWNFSSNNSGGSLHHGRGSCFRKLAFRELDLQPEEKPFNAALAIVGFPTPEAPNIIAY